jgi:hypothetical protein
MEQAPSRNRCRSSQAPRHPIHPRSLAQNHPISPSRHQRRPSHVAPADRHAMQEAPPEGRVIGNRFIPAAQKSGSASGACAAMLGFSAPTRLCSGLRGGLKRGRNGSRRWRLLWGNGRHRCLGRTIALIELNKVIAEVCALLTWRIWG